MLTKTCNSGSNYSRLATILPDRTFVNGICYGEKKAIANAKT
jgi:hypothetical protein